MLPAEELALKRALYASLMQESPKKKPLSDGETTPVKKIKLEYETGPLQAKKNKEVSDTDMLLPLERLNLQQNIEGSNIDVICLSSPDLSEDESQGSSNIDQALTVVSSCPSSPMSYRSTNSLHLCLSSSSSSSWCSGSESSDSSCDSLFSPWRPGIKKRKKMSKGKGKVGKSAPPKKGLLNCEEKCDMGSVGTRKPDGDHRGKQQTARKSAAPFRPDIEDSQAHRKFATNHVPPAMR
jgi:hypothetical protein